MQIEKKLGKLRFYWAMFQYEPTSPCKNTLSGGIGTGDKSISAWFHFKLFGVRILVVSLTHSGPSKKKNNK